MTKDERHHLMKHLQNENYDCNICEFCNDDMNMKNLEMVSISEKKNIASTGSNITPIYFFIFAL